MADFVIQANQNDCLEQYARRNGLRVYRIPKNKYESTDEIVMDMCQNKLTTIVSVP